MKHGANNMIFIYGHPAAGKTTLAKLLEKQLDKSIRCGNDQSRDDLNETTTALLKNELNIYKLTAKRTFENIQNYSLPLVDVTFSTEIKRNAFFDDFQFEQIPALIIRLTTSKEICRFRVQERQDNNDGLKDLLWFDNLMQETTAWNPGNHLDNYYILDVCAVDGKWYTNDEPIKENNELAKMYNQVLSILKSNILP
jgi:predicted kinase